MSEEGTKGEKPFVLVNITNLEKVAFLKRAPLDRIGLWAKLFGSNGLVTKRLDLITDPQTLQYLFWNLTHKPPGDQVGENLSYWSVEVLQEKLAVLADNEPVDNTSVEELTSQMPSMSIGDQTKENNDMGQGGTAKDLTKDGEGGEEAGKKKASKKGSKKAAAKEAAPKKEKDPTGRPSAGTATGKVWEIADKLAKANGDVTPTRAAVVEAAVKAGINKATAGVQYGAWMKGLNRTPAPKPVKEEKATSETKTEEEGEGEEE